MQGQVIPSTPKQIEPLKFNNIFLLFLETFR